MFSARSLKDFCLKYKVEISFKYKRDELSPRGRGNRPKQKHRCINKYLLDEHKSRLVYFLHYFKLFSTILCGKCCS